LNSGSAAGAVPAAVVASAAEVVVVVVSSLGGPDSLCDSLVMFCVVLDPSSFDFDNDNNIDDDECSFVG
jgi:hypothetical protein